MSIVRIILNMLLNIVFFTFCQRDPVRENATNMSIVVVVEAVTPEVCILRAVHKFSLASWIHTASVHIKLTPIIARLVELICSRDGCFEISIDSIERVFILICWGHLKCGQQFLFLNCIAAVIACINVVSIPVLPSQSMLSTIIARARWA